MSGQTTHHYIVWLRLRLLLTPGPFTFSQLQKMKKIIDFHWAIISMLALSGAAGPLELLGGPAYLYNCSHPHSCCLSSFDEMCDLVLRFTK